MNRKLVLKMLGYVLALEAGLLMLPLMVGLYYRERCVQIGRASCRERV